MNDISAGKTARDHGSAAANRLSQLNLHSAEILDRVADAFVALDRNFNIAYANREACRINQKPLEEFVGNNLFEEWPASAGSELERQYRRAMEHGVDVHFEHRYVAEPYDVWLEIDVYPSPDGLNIFYRDVSERKRIQSELRKSEERYRSLINATAEIVWTNSAEGRMLGPQPGWGEFTGQAEAQYSNYGWSEAVHPEDVHETLRAWKHSVETNTPFLTEHRVRRFDGVYRKFAVRAVAVLEHDGSVREWVGVHTDVTERRAMEAARETLLRDQGVFLRDVLSSVTEGKLLLSTTPAQLPDIRESFGDAIPLTRETGTSAMRERVTNAAAATNLPEERKFDLLTATGEAAMNAIVHGGGGIGIVSISHNGGIQVRIEDKGGGIAMENLPRATLSRGFSTKSSLGHGLKLMIETVDRLYLMTDSAGTTVVLEQERERPLPAWLDLD